MAKIRSKFSFWTDIIMMVHFGFTLYNVMGLVLGWYMYVCILFFCKHTNIFCNTVRFSSVIINY